MAILNNNPLIGSGGNQGYNINNSLRFRSSASAYLNRTPASAGSQTTWTWSAWVKRGTLGTRQAIFITTNAAGNDYVGLEFTASDKIAFFANDANVTERLRLETNALFRDPSAWYHIVGFFNTTQATSTNRAAIYVNGNLQTYSTTTYMPQNYNGRVNTTNQHNIGTWLPALSAYFDGYIADVNFIDGQALTPTSFGETDTTTGVWKPKAYSGTYGTNGFYLKFSDIATTSGSNAGLGKDFSGNSNYWTTNNISVTSGATYDAMTDSPTNTSATVANYCVLNPVDNASGATITNGNLETTAVSGAYKSNFGTLFVTSGKWYAEFTVVAGSNDSRMIAGIGTKLTGVTNQLGNDTYSYSINWSSSTSAIYKRTNNTDTTLTSTANLTNGSVIMVALDLDNNKLWFGQDGTWFDSGNPASGTNQIFSIIAGEYTIMPCTYEDGKLAANYGQRPFAYTPPTGFVALNTFNLPTPTILQGNKYMDATLWTGNGSSQSIVNASGFKPDLVWVKSRSNTFNNDLFNSTSGVNKFLVSDTTAAEATVSGTLTAFNSNGFSVGSDIGLNYSGGTYVGWQWQAGQGSTSSNTSGSITSTVSVNTTAGFSIVTYTGNGTNGATVGHGLGVAPKMIILKSRSDGTYNWRVYHSNLTSGYSIAINSTAAETQFATNAGYISAVSSTTFTLTQSGANTLEAVNKNGDNYVAYCWAEIAGFSRFTSYTGNGSADGPFIFLGFRPKFVMYKRTDTTGGWVIIDTSRDTYNYAEKELYPHLSNAENTGSARIDILSNGYKIRSDSTYGYINASGGTYIVAAFAENPFKNSNAR